MRTRIAALTSGFIYPYHRQLFSGIASAAEAFGVDLVGIPCGPANIRNDELEMRNILYDHIDPSLYDGFIVPYSSFGQYCGYEELERRLAGVFARPSVAIGGILAGHPSVIPDDSSGVSQLFVHLIRGHGCRKFLFIRGEDRHITSSAREAAARAAISGCGLPEDSLEPLTGQMNAAAAREAMDRFRAAGRLADIDAIVAVSDSQAIAAMQRLQELGLRVPEDIIVCGSSGYEDSEYCRPSLTTVDVGVERNGYEALRILLELIGGGKVPDVTMHPSSPLIRQSCGCAALDGEGSGQHRGADMHSYFNLFRQFGYSLINRADFSELFNLLHRYLGTRNVFLSLFEPGGPPFRESRLVSAFRDGRMLTLGDEGIAFRTARFLPAEFLPDERSTLVIEPLYYENEHLGIIALDFEARNGLVYEAITAQIAGAIQNQSQRSKIEEAELRFHDMALVSSDWLWEIDARGSIVYSSDGVERLLGFPNNEIAGRDFFELFSPSEEEMRLSLKNALLLEREPIQDREVPATRKDGEALFLQLSGKPLYGKNQAFRGFRGACRDITLSKRAEERIQNFAYYDQLTGLPNRRLLMDRMENLIRSSKREAELFAVLFIDLDNFKTVNDSLGHDAGDAVLKGMAELFNSCIREGDTLARVGGDEFVLVLPRVKSEEVVRAVASRIAARFSESSTASRGTEHAFPQVTSSIGIAIFPRDGNDAQSVLKKADIAMYASKGAGKNRFTFYAAEKS